MSPGMLSLRNGISLKAKNYGLDLGLGLDASSLGLVDAVASALTMWPCGLLFCGKTLLYV